MKLLLRQRIFSWFDSYDIYDDCQTLVFHVEGKLAWGHRLEISDHTGKYLGRINEEIFSFLPRFSLYVVENDTKIGEIKKEFALFRSVYTLNCADWSIEGDWVSWEFSVRDGQGNRIMEITKELFHFSDTYTLEIFQEEHTLLCLMIMLAIDAANCSNN